MWSALPLLLLTRPLVQIYCCCFSCYIEKKKKKPAYYLPTHIFLSLSVSLFYTRLIPYFFSSKFITYHLKLWLQSINYMIIRAFHLTDLPEIKMNRSPENLNSGTIYSLLCHYKPVWFYFFIGKLKEMHTTYKVLSNSKNYKNITINHLFHMQKVIFKMLLFYLIVFTFLIDLFFFFWFFFFFYV